MTAIDTQHGRLARLRATRDRGFATIEAVVVIPVIVVLTMMVVQWALLYHGRNVVQAAAQDALRVARGYQSTAAIGKSAGEEYLAKVAPNLLSHRGCDVQRNARSVSVTCHADVSSVIPFGRFHATGQASGPVESFNRGG